MDRIGRQHDDACGVDVPSQAELCELADVARQGKRARGGDARPEVVRVPRSSERVR